MDTMNEEREYVMWGENEPNSQLPLSILRQNFSEQDLVCGRILYNSDPILEEIMFEMVESLSQFLNTRLMIKDFSSWYGTDLRNVSRNNLLLGKIDLVIGINFPSDTDNTVIAVHPLIRNAMSCMYFLDIKSLQRGGIFWFPFSSYLLTSVFSMGFLLAVSTCIASRLAPESLKRKHVDSSKNLQNSRINCLLGCLLNPIDVGNFLMWFITSLTSQEGVLFPKAKSGRILLLSAMFFSFIICNTYSGSIASFLSVKVSQIKKIDDILENEKFRVGFVNDSHNELQLKNTKNEIVQKIYKYSVSDSKTLPNSTNEAIHRVLSGGYAAFLGRRVARAALNVATLPFERCQVAEMPVEKTDGQLAFATLKNSPLERIIQHLYLKSLESGIEHYRKMKFVGEMPRCDFPYDFTQIKIDDVYPAFIFLLYGVLFSILICIFENIWQKIIFTKKRRKRQRTKYKKVRVKLTCNF